MEDSAQPVVLHVIHDQAALERIGVDARVGDVRESVGVVDDDVVEEGRRVVGNLVRDRDRLYEGIGIQVPADQLLGAIDAGRILEVPLIEEPCPVELIDLPSKHRLEGIDVIRSVHLQRWIRLEQRAAVDDHDPVHGGRNPGLPARHGEVVVALPVHLETGRHGSPPVLRFFERTLCCRIWEQPTEAVPAVEDLVLAGISRGHDVHRSLVSL